MSATELPNLQARPVVSNFRDLRPIMWSVGLVWVTVLAYLAFADRTRIVSDFPAMLGWIVLGAVVNLIPLRGWQSAPFTADEPITLAVAIVFRPVEAAMITFLAAFDPTELRGDTTVGKSLWNRSQISVAWCAGSTIAHLVAGRPEVSRAIIPLAFLVLTLASVLNYSFVAWSLAFERRYAFRDVVRRMKIGLSTDFLLVFLAWGILAAMLIVLYTTIGRWALPAFLPPILLARQALARSQEYLNASTAYRSSEAALIQMSKQFHQERTDERHLIAGDLHDEILQPLFKVSLISQVLRTEIANRRLSDAEEDLQDLISATDVAAGSLRGLIGDLRKPGLGVGGLSEALTRLVDASRQSSTPSVHVSIERIEMTPERQLIAYQIAKEALANALHHSHAANLWVELRRDGEFVVVSVRDDGDGFDPYLGREGHYGIHIMKERAAAAGGSFFLDSAPGSGCVVTAALPDSGPLGTDQSKD